MIPACLNGVLGFFTLWKGVMEVRTYKGSDLKIGAKLALKHRLFVSGWNINTDLHFILKNNDEDNDQFRIALVFKDDNPVCIALLEGSKLQVFCRKSERFKGYGTKAAYSITEVNRYFRWEFGIDGSAVFFNKLKGKLYDAGRTY